MGTLIQDMSRFTPAPTVGRESAVLVVSVIVIAAVFGTVAAVTDNNPVLYIGIGAALVALQLGRWVYRVAKGNEV